MPDLLPALPELFAATGEERSEKANLSAQMANGAFNISSPAENVMRTRPNAMQYSQFVDSSQLDRGKKGQFGSCLESR